MYGYVFAAAEAGLRHILTEGVVVYPDDVRLPPPPWYPSSPPVSRSPAVILYQSPLPDGIPPWYEAGPHPDRRSRRVSG
jgi:hypothetical protein